VYFYILPYALLEDLYKFRGFAGQTIHKKYMRHYEVSTKDFPINFSSIVNWLCKWYERGQKTYYYFKKKIYNYQ
jgi:hypothetical protein